MLFAILGIIVVVYLCIEFKFIRKLIAKLFFGTLVVALMIYGACAAQNAARAEEIPDGFYYRICFIDEVEELDKELLVYVDDLDHLWAYYEDYPEEDEEFDEFDRDMSNIILHFVIDNQLEAAFDKEERVVRGRLVLLTMWEANKENPFDDEIIDVYYSELVTW